MIDKIIDFSGYTYTSAFFDTPYFRSLIIPNNKGNLEQLTKDLLLVYGNNSLEGGANMSAAGQLAFNTISNLINFTKDVANTSFTYDGAVSTLGKISLKGTISLSRPGSFTLSVYQSATLLYTEKSIILSTNS